MPKLLIQVLPTGLPQLPFGLLNKLIPEVKLRSDTAQLPTITEMLPTQMQQLLGQLLMLGLHRPKHGLLQENCGRVVQRSAPRLLPKLLREQLLKLLLKRLLDQILISRPNKVSLEFAS
jgi:hypothetical protein